METSAIAIAQSNLINDPDAAFDLVLPFHTARRSDEAGLKTLRDELGAKSNEKLYGNLGKAWDLITQIRNEVTEEAQAALLKLHGYEQRRGCNPFPPFANMLWGSWVPLAGDKKAPPKAKVATVNGQTRWFKVNRSADRYGQVFRYADELGLTGELLTAKLHELTMDKIVKADTEKHSKSDQDALDLATWRKAVLAEPPLGTADRTKLGIPKDYGDTFACIWGSFAPDGMFMARGQYPVSTDTISRHVDKLARKDGRELHLKQREAAIAASEAGDSAATNDE